MVARSTRNVRRIAYIPTALGSLTATAAAALSKVDSLESQTDALFAQWNNPGSPGCVCSVLSGGRTVYSKGYGMADLEHNVPLTPASVFYLPSTTKQFTAASIALLILQGKLSVS